ncbi:hypothetical protein HWB57_gp173 [Erwinia phage vB_EamM-Bue1]|uniref:Uncharacterized protein n=1 Tax=Erwinia phage vB_EamM-Bue1 TaxID=2099338 RepID=A0A2P1JUG8_9CAUD|nr:hypothetical protein HWB57_gp173 [Erwinia phage vB_EamM-Bue1]AVO22999.1 hypothetical protein [Erwinia phage vB_EamM-Bue1]
MTTSKLFEAVEDDSPIWVGIFNGSTIEIYDRPETGAEEIYSSADTIEKAATDLAAFLDSAQPEDYRAERTPDATDEVVVYVGNSPWTSFSIEGSEDGQMVVAGDIQLDDAELDYLQQNGVLPDPDKFGDVTIDMDNPDDDFWVSPSGAGVE